MILKDGIDKLIIEMDRKEGKILAEALMEARRRIQFSKDIKEIEDFSISKEYQIIRNFAFDLYYLPF